MDMEQLKLIIELAEKAGENGSDLFIAYLVMDKLPGLIGSITFLVFVAVVVWQGLRILKDANSLEVLRKAAGVGICFDDRELRKAAKCLEENYSKTVL